MAMQEATQRRTPGPAPYGGAPDAGGERLASALGWFGIGLGLAELAAPGTLAQIIGVEDDDRNRRILRAFGLREIASGVGILARPRTAGWVWSRVGGDAMDLALLGSALASDRSRRDRVAAAAAAVVGVTLLDVFCGRRLSEGGGARDGRGTAAWLARKALGRGAGARDVRVTKTITIGRPADELYRFWRDVENLPRVMRHLESVRTTGEGRSHWKARAPLGRTAEWDAEIVEDEPNERIAWRSLAGADIDNEGSVAFERAPGGRGTVVRVALRYAPPGGAVGATLAKLFGKEPGQEVEEDLRRFKQVMEVGEVVLSDATAKGWGAGRPPSGGGRE